MSAVQTRDSRSGEQWATAPGQAREAAEAASTEPGWGNVGQGPRDSVDETFSSSNLGNFTFYQAHKAEIIAAAARGEHRGQPKHTATPPDNT